MSTYTIYFVPAESPDEPYLVRRWETTAGDARPMEIVGTGRTLEAARLIVPIEADACMHRDDSDDPVIVETWI